MTNPTPAGPLAAPASWDLVADGYTDVLLPQFEEYARDALRLAQLPAGARVLDVATGPGTLALLAARELGASVSAIDFSPLMLSHLGRRADAAGITIDARVGDGQALPFDDAAFDGAFSLFGLMFFPDRAAGFRELRRVLRPGGRAVVSSWAPFEGAFGEVLAAIRAALPELPFGQGKTPLADAGEMQAEMRDAGFAVVDVHTIRHAGTYPSTQAFWDDMVRSSAPVALLRRNLGESKWAQTGEAIRRELERRIGSGAVESYGTAHLGVGVR